MKRMDKLTSTFQSDFKLYAREGYEQCQATVDFLSDRGARRAHFTFPTNPNGLSASEIRQVVDFLNEVKTAMEQE